MAVFTKLYLHDALQSISGTPPPDDEMVMNAADYIGALFAADRSVSTTIGVSQASVPLHLDDLDVVIYGAAGKFVSLPLDGAQTVGDAAEKAIAHGAGAVSEAFRQTTLCFCVYVWRPSAGGSVVGIVSDTHFGEETNVFGTTETALTVDPTFTPLCTAVAAADGDHIVVEWGAYSISTDPSFDVTLYYDGTTEDSATSNAAYVSIPSPATLEFQGDEPPPPAPGFLADVQVLTQPGATGQQTYSLSANFDPKAVILWATPLTADGTVAHYSFGVGFGTYRGSVVQQRYVCIRGLDAAATADVARGANSDALLCLLTDSAGSAARNLEIDLVSMQSGDTSQVVLDWVNLHSTASIRVSMLVLGGSNITDALVDDFTLTTASSTQDETVVSGFGKPELLFMSSAGQFSFADEASSPATSFGFGKQGEAGRGWGFGQAWGNTASLTGTRQRSDRILTLNSNASDYALGSLDTTVGNWPTDGFRLLYDAQPGNALIVSYLALRTTAQITTGENTALTAGSTQDNACGFAPKLGFVFGWNLPADSTLQTAAADQCGFGIGAYDGTTEAWAGFTEDDAALTMDSNSQQTIAKVIRNYSPAAALQSEADATFSGNDFRLTWTTLDTVAREYQWLAIGDELPPTIPQIGVFDPHLDARAWF